MVVIEHAHLPIKRKKLFCHHRQTAIMLGLTSACLLVDPVSAGGDKEAIAPEPNGSQRALPDRATSSESKKMTTNSNNTSGKGDRLLELETERRTNERQTTMTNHATCNPFSSLVSPSTDTSAMQEFANAYALQKEQKLVEAMKHYKSVLKVLPDCFEAYYNVGLCQRENGNVFAAITSFEKTATLHPFFKPVYKDLADLYSRVGQTSEAQAAESVYHQL